MRKIVLSVLMVLLASFQLAAQNQRVSGTVTGPGGESLAGAAVVLNGTNVTVLTDANGQYSINIPADGVLVFSYLGMEDQEVAVAGRTIVNVVLQPASHTIDDVIVVAYGTAKREAFTGSAAVVGEEALSKRQVSNVSQALAGQVAGVQTSSTTGQPGSSATVRIRGYGSLSASNAPLYVVDGVPYEGASLAAINPNDIESMSVLKDAAANAIYGARGANGVILVTTKKGRSGDAVITLDAKWGVNSRGVPNYNVMTDPAMYVETMYKALYNWQAYGGASMADAHAFADQNLWAFGTGIGYQIYTIPDGERAVGTNFKLNPNATLGYLAGDYYITPDSWYDEMFKSNNLRQEYNVAVSGGGDKINYYMSVGYLDDTGIMPNSGFNRYTAMVKTDYQAKKWLRVGGSMSYTNYNQQAPGAQTDWGSSGNLFYIANMIAPVYPVYQRDADGNIMVDSNGITMYDFGNNIPGQQRSFQIGTNPFLTLDLNKYSDVNDVFIGRWYAQIDIVKGLKFNANISTNLSTSRRTSLSNLFYGNGALNDGWLGVYNYRYFTVDQQYLFTYVFDLGNEHSLDLLAGYETYNYTSQYLAGVSEQLYNPFVPELDNAIFATPSVGSSTGRYATMGFLARAQYDYLGKYFASASFRRDASSRFHPDNRWGTFGSVGGAWIISKEDFAKDISWVNHLKLKASYGIQGNDNLGNNYPYLDQYGVSGTGSGEFQIVLEYKGNPDITWETSYNFNVGTEFELFKSRLNGSVEFFTRKAVDLLYNKPVPPSLGYSSYPVNVGTLRNTGFEVDLTGVIINKKDFSWSVNLNASHIKNKVLDLDADVKDRGIRTGMRIIKIGGSIYQSFLKQWAGLDENGRDTWYVDVTDADGNVTGRKATTNWSAATQYDCGDTLPALYGGFGTSLTWKGLDFSMAFTYQLGGKIYDFSYQEFLHTGRSNSTGLNWHRDILDAWTPENTDTNIHRLSAGDDNYQLLSDFFLTDASYLTLSNVTLGYTLPAKWTSKLSVKSVRVYVAGDNLFLLSKRQGLDPRMNLAGGVDYTGSASGGRYTNLRTISAGINLSF